MPNRILRDWTDSENVDKLSVYAERFLARLIMKVDDYGRYSANAKILKSILFPLKTDVRETDVTRWKAECQAAGLIVLYNVASKEYLQIENFKQALRQKVEKYPAPPLLIECIADATQLHSECVHETKGKESESETKEKSGKPPLTPEELEFSDVQQWMKTNAPAVLQMKEPLTQDQYFKLKTSYGPEFVSDILLKMHNWKDLNKKRTNAYLTFINSFAVKEKDKAL